MTDGARPYTPEVLQAKIQKRANDYRLSSKPASEAAMGLAMGALEMCFAPDADSDRKRRTLQKWLTGHEPIAGHDCLALLDWMKPTKDSGGAWGVSPEVAAEARAALTQAMVDAGQMALPL